MRLKANIFNLKKCHTLNTSLSFSIVRLFLEMILMKTVKVGGDSTIHRVFIYALSTCGWCKLTKKFMEDGSIAYEYIDVDKASSEEKREIGASLKERNIPLGFPITIIDDDVIITGYKPRVFLGGQQGRSTS